MAALGVLLILHRRVKRDVRRHARGFLGVTTIVDWRHGTLLSISLWDDYRSIYSMGDVPRHILATRVPPKLGIRTASGIYCYAGDWRRVLFRSRAVPRSPLRPLADDVVLPINEGG